MKALPLFFAGLILIGGATDAYHAYESRHVVTASASAPVGHAGVVPQVVIWHGPGQLSRGTSMHVHVPHVPHVLHVFRPYVIRRVFHPFRAFRYSMWGF